uniref:Ceramide synthase 5 n=1 Tax=Astyanax mexicanus TaxID=7994 RepID=A0A8B9KI23_ASTMX
MAALVDWFWDERFWLPHNVTWADLADPAPGVEYPKAGHLLRALPLALGIFVVRIFFESGGQPEIPQPQEEAFYPGAFLNSRKLDGLSKQLDWDVRKIQRWFRHRRNQDKPSTRTKFCEKLAFYWSLMFSQFTDIKRKDFLIMFVHHLATVSLISFSYANNMVRVGSLVLCVHDTSDFLLEAAKLANYAKYQRLCDFLFVVFGAAFFGTRLIIYPFWILNSTMFESWEIVGPYASWWVFNPLLLVLQVLHIIWSYLIARIAFKALMRGKNFSTGFFPSLSSSSSSSSSSEGRCCLSIALSRLRSLAFLSLFSFLSSAVSVSTPPLHTSYIL